MPEFSDHHLFRQERGNVCCFHWLSPTLLRQCFLNICLISCVALIAGSRTYAQTGLGLVTVTEQGTGATVQNINTMNGAVFGMKPDSKDAFGSQATRQASGGVQRGKALGTNPIAVSPDAARRQTGLQQTPDLQTVDELPPLAQTQFQRFVREATGKDLPLHGFRLFDRVRFPSVTSVPVPSNYVLGPGDEIDLKIWGAVDLSIRLEVDREGQVMIPRVGPVSMMGVTALTLDAHLSKHVAKVFTNFELSATVGKLRSIQIFVLGQARSPGAHVVSSLSTLISAVFESGGPSASGSMRRIDLIRLGKRISSIDLYQFIQTGDTSADVRLLSGDVVLIHPAGPRVALQGAIDNPAIFELAPGQETLGSVLVHSGSSVTLVAPQKVIVERVDQQKVSGPREVYEFALNDVGLKNLLRDGDLVTLLTVSPKFGNAVTLRGNVASPLRYTFRPGMRISDLIPSPEALIQPDYYAKQNSLVQIEKPPTVKLENSLDEVKNKLAEINWDYASVERVNLSEVRTTLIPFNLGKAVRQKDPSQNLELQPGDIITIFSVNDIQVPLANRTQFVKITGEVNFAGIYPISAGDSLLSLIERAGGLTADAYVFGTSFVRESARLQQQLSLEQAIRRAEEKLYSDVLALSQNSPDADRSRFLESQLAAQRAAIERFRTLKANGRMTLELDPMQPRLPAVRLQDGDVVYVPPQPDYVSVYGAVAIENAFLYRAGATLEDYLNKAGLNRGADLEAIVLIRADGSALSSQAGKSWLASFNNTFLKTRVYPGDTVFVPELVDRRSGYTQFIQGAKDLTQVFFQLGLGAAAIRTLRN